MKTLYALTFFLVLTLFAPKSHAQLVNYEDDSGWTFGLNMGVTWQESDIYHRWRGGLAGGFTLGKYITRREGRFFSLELRGRGLWGNTYGQDAGRHYGLQYNDVFNGSRDTAQFSTASTLAIWDSTNTAYTIHNNKTKITDWSLEMVLHLQELRDRTNIVLYGFGGIGFTKHQAFTDQVDGLGNRYEYSLFDSTSAFTDKQQADNIYAFRDLDYETEADGNEDAMWTFMPHAGIGLGYQFTPRFMIGIEHRMTWTLTDIFDGQRWNTNNRATGSNDIYHYTHLRLRWNIRGGGSGHTGGPVDPGPNGGGGGGSGITTGQPPRVTINNSCPVTVRDNLFTLNARIDNVTSRSGVTLTVNGQPINSFTYNGNTGQFQASLVLQPGTNTYVIRASNQYGEDSEQCVVLYDVPVDNNLPPPPTVNITNPGQCPIEVGVRSFNVQAQILNVASRNDIQFRVNGQTITNFTWNSSTNMLNAVISLNDGPNNILITGTNQVGSDSDNCQIIFKPVLNLPPPIVNITNPPTNPYTTNTNVYTVTAEIFNVSSVNDVYLRVNGADTRNFTFNPNTRQFSTTATLNIGANTFQITGTNTVGSDTESTVIIYQPVTNPCDPPIVNLTQPNADPFITSTPNTTIRAYISNLSTAQGITFSLNGQLITNYSFNPNTGQLVWTGQLMPGSNNLQIIAVNECGNGSAGCTLIYNEPCQSPIVNITQPNSNTSQTTNPTGTVQAQIQNITNASQITMRINGLVVNNYTYNAASRILSWSGQLNIGTNTFMITATNNCGTDTKTVTILRDAPCIPPTINITMPATSPQAVTTATGTVKAYVLNIAGSGNITFKVNNIVRNDYTYNSNTHQLVWTGQLNMGSNTIQISTTNACGDANKTVVITRSNPCTPPTVTLTQPNANPHTTTMPTITVQANVTQLGNSAGITFKVNGVVKTDFIYNATSDIFSWSGQLNVGSNTFEITAANACGTDTKVVTVVRPDPCQPPVVTVTRPQSNPFTTNVATTSIKATLLYVVGPPQITFKVNGVAVTNYQWSNSTKLLSWNGPVNLGANSFEITATNDCGTDTKVVTVNREVLCVPPTVDMILPASSPFATTNAAETVKAKVENVTGPSQITMTVNGVAQTNFSYSLSTKQLTWTGPMTIGTNLVQITATNECGSQTKTSTIDRSDPCIPPVVTLMEPASTPITISVANMTIAAEVKNVAGPQEITLKVNGVTQTNFTYNVGSKIMTWTGPLNVGANNFQITATNACGTDAENFIITRPPPCIPPVVTITDPTANPHTTSNTSATVSGTVTNVTNKNQIIIKMKGVVISKFSFNSSTGVFTFNRSLVEGNNDVVVTATNGCGNDSKTTVIRYQVPGSVPAIVVSNPPTELFNTNNSSISINGTVSGITAKADMSVKINGAYTQNFSYNPTTKGFIFQTNLNLGQNDVILTATNQQGTSTKNLSIIYSTATGSGFGNQGGSNSGTVQPPVITMVAPQACPKTVPMQSATMKAKVSNITSPNDIVVKINGTAVNFGYNMNTTVLTVPFTLQPGSNAVEVIASNAGGSATKQCELIWNSTGGSNNSGQTTPPIVNITYPVNNFTSGTETITLQGTATGITSGNQLVIKQNGYTKAGSYNAANNQFQVNLTLKNGSNTIIVTATNAAGPTTKYHTILYDGGNKANPATQPKPSITMIAPKTTSKTTDKPTFLVKAKVLNVKGRNEIMVKANGQSKPFSYNSSTKEISANVPLRTGKNTIVITAGGSGNTVTKTITISRTQVTRPAAKPIITMMSPTRTTISTKNSSYSVKAKILNVASKSQITVKVNGSTKSFAYSTGSKIMTLNASLRMGKNSIVITAGTGSNRVTKTISITRTASTTSGGSTTTTRPGPSVAKPTITMTAPRSTSVSTGNSTYSVKATIKNVKSKSAVTVKVNGVSKPFSLNTSSGSMTANVPLKGGKNTIVITAGTGSNRVTKTITITRTVGRGGTSTGGTRGGK